MSRIHSSFIAFALLGFATPALADPAPAPAVDDDATSRRFGDGQVALHLNEGMNFASGDLLSGAQIQVDYFVAGHLSLGLMVGANWYSTAGVSGGDSTHETVFRIGPRVGYDLPLSDVVSFWPQVGVDYRSDSQSAAAASGFSTGASVPTTSNTETTTAFGLIVVAPIVLHPTRGFFIGAGPSFYTELTASTSNSGGGSSDNGKVTSLGLSAMIGGNF